MKEILSIVAVVLTFAAYIPYYRDILKGKTHPHIYTWSLWGLLTVLIVALQFIGGAGPSVWITVAAGIMCLGVIALGFKNGKRYITMIDTAIAALALAAIIAWLIIDQPVISLWLVIIADLLAFIPTVRKAWKYPYSETLSLYVTNAVRFIIALLALETFTFLSAGWVIAWISANVLFSIILIARRGAMPKKSK
jgi:hypothetical protein